MADSCQRLKTISHSGSRKASKVKLILENADVRFSGMKKEGQIQSEYTMELFSRSVFIDSRGFARNAELVKMWFEE